MTIRTVTVTLTFDAEKCLDVTPENYDPMSDVESICDYGAEHFNLIDWKIESESVA